MKKKYYTIYKITNLINEYIYIGCHVTNNLNDSYMGSGTNIKKVIKDLGVVNFKKETLFVYNNKQEMLLKELELVNNDFIKRDDTYNINLGGVYNSANTVTVKDKDGNTLKVHITDERYLNGELLHISKGTVTVKDFKGDTHQVSLNDPRYLSKELISIHKGLAVVKDKNDKKFTVSIKDKRYLNGELVGITKGLMLVKDKKGNVFHIKSNDVRFLSGELVGITRGHTHTNETKEKIGKTNNQQGKNNSQYGTCWIHNKTLQQTKKIKKNNLSEWLNQGWTKGRK